MSLLPPAPVLAAYGFDAHDVAPIAGGLINATFAVRSPDGAPVAVLQRLHPVFGADVHLDIEAVTRHLAAKGMPTPHLIPALDGRRWVEVDGAVWRTLSWVDGVTIHKVPDPRWAEAGGALVGRFHRAVADLRHDYAFARAGVHDTAGHLERLRRAAAAHDAGTVTAPGADADADAAWLREAAALGREVLAAATTLPPLPAQPLRHCHGDLKISNILFHAPTDAAPPQAICLIDLDTLGLQTMAFELGDALRSWCNPHGEDLTTPTFDLPIFAAAMRGYADAAGGLLAPPEIASIVDGLYTVCVELAARFCTDTFEDRYFGWNADRFPSRRAHNLVRATGQLGLARSVAAARTDALDIAHTAFGR
jgi:Ser/Thr protein kinase RdoA (MazF antagonist)